MRHPRMRASAVILACLVVPLAGAAQQLDTLPAAAKTAAAPDSAKQIRPATALWRSLLIPGWGQASTGRHVTGAAFVLWEGVTIMMTFRAIQEENYMIAAQADSFDLQSKRQQVQDWTVLWIFNHFFAGAEAYVSAHLMDFPKELKLEALPRGLAVRMSF
ncbi:MAG TPA: hypothetical protein VLV45_00275 [Gemmatimonadales bacterium]|nr:hypothetical protein [Gemmatimonadales bacterium]